MTLIDRLERRFGWIAIPGVVKVIVAFQALIWVLNMFRDNDLIFHLLLYLDKDLILSGQVWRLFSFILIPPVEAMLWEQGLRPAPAPHLRRAKAHHDR